MKKIVFILLFVLTSASYGYQSNDGSTVVFADLLDWKLREANAENWAQIITPPGAERSADIIGAPFHWDTGYRVGIGHYSHDDQWYSTLYYTRYHTTGDGHASGEVYSAYLGNFYVNNVDGASFGPHYHDASVKWKFAFDNIDLELGHTFDIDHIVMLHPFVGLKAAWIDQDIDSNWQDPVIPTNFTSATEDLTNDFRGVGPSLGVNTTWPIHQAAQSAFNLFGNFSGALLWGSWHFKDIYQNNIGNTVTINTSDIVGAAPMVRAQMGLEWVGSYTKANVAVRLGYEAQVWFNQLQYYSFNGGRLNNLMSVQGGVLDFSLNF